MARTEDTWQIRNGTYIEPSSVLGWDILIKGSNRYLNFDTLSGSTGYGFRDNAGTIEFKNSGGSWTGIGTGSSTVTTNSSLTGDGSGGSPLGLNLAHENTWTTGQVFNDPDVTYTPQPPPSSSADFVLDSSGGLSGGIQATGVTYQYYIYSYYFDGTSYAYDSLGIFTLPNPGGSGQDPTDGNYYTQDLVWSSGNDANGYLIYDFMTGNWLDVGNVTSYTITSTTSWNIGGFPSLTPNSLVDAGHPVWANKTQDWSTTDFNVMAMGLSGTNHLQLRWKYTGGSGSGALRFESDDGILRTINANLYADTIVAASSISGYIYPTTLGQNYIAYGSSGGYITGASNFIFNPSTTRLLVSNAGITPQNQLHMHYSTATAVYAQFTNSATGSTSADGFRIGIDSSGAVELRNYEASAINIYTQNILRANIPSGGVTQLNVYGFVRGAYSGIATTSTDGLVAANDASATSGVPVQRSPRLRFYGHVWNGTSTKVESWIVEPASQTSGATPTSVLAFGREYDLGTGYTYHMNLSSSGNLNIGGGNTAGALKFTLSSGQAGVPDGSVSAPSYTFTTSTNTGLYLGASSILYIAQAGNDIMRFSNTQMIAYKNITGVNTKTYNLNYDAGSASVPSYSFNNDANTGMWSSGADTLNFTTGGTDRLTLTTTDITVADSFNFIFNTTTGTKIGTATTQKLGFWNATPIVQPTTAVGSATLVSPGAGTNIKSDDTFDGYTLQQIVKLIRNLGIAA